MKKLWKNFTESWDMGWNNLCGKNRVIIIILLFPTALNGLLSIIADVLWLINKIF